jgi:Rad3-related DNA helicase
MRDGLFGSGARTTPPLDAGRFKQAVVQQYGGDGQSIRECIGNAVDDHWPVGVTEEGVAVRREGEFKGLDPSYREHQREAVVDTICHLYVDDADVVTLSAPTGAGKSLILHGVTKVISEVSGRDGFFTTPLNALIDQVDNDEFIESDIITLKGKNNYDCIHPHDRGTSVDKAVCQRVSDFDCEVKGDCPYYGRKAAAQEHPEVVTNMSYLMANAMIPDEVESKFMPRETLEVDECQKIEDFAIQFVGFTVSKFTVPLVYDDLERPPHGDDSEDSQAASSVNDSSRSASREVDRLATWLEDEVLRKVRTRLDTFENKAELTEDEAEDRDRLEDFARKVNNFLADVRNHHWVATRESDGDGFNIEFKPIYVGRFLDRFLWSQGHKVILSSATIPRGDFLEEVGLDTAHVEEVNVPSTFPVERRPVIKDPVGKMTMGQRDSTIPTMARRIGELAREYAAGNRTSDSTASEAEADGEDHRGFVHCHSYSIAERLYDNLPTDVKEVTRVQDADNREASLEDWLAADAAERGYGDSEGGRVFLSVAMDEGISLDDDKTRWQAVAKAAYPFMGDKRVDYRMNELNDWTWYAGKAAINLQQAVGRGMRSKDDWCDTYILDTSATTLIERNEYLFEDWFLDAVGESPCGASGPGFDVPSLD